MLLISPDQLSDLALGGLVEEFVTRDGTDYGATELSLEQKSAAIYRQLRSGEIVIVFDEQSGCASLLGKEQLRELQ